MNPLRATFLAFAVVGGLAACDILSDQTTIPKLTKCAGPVAADIWDRLNSVLRRDGSAELSSGVVEELDELARNHGSNLLKCLLDEFVLRNTAPGSSQDPANVAAAHRAMEYMEMRR